MSWIPTRHRFARAYLFSEMERVRNDVHILANKGVLLMDTFKIIGIISALEIAGIITPSSAKRCTTLIKAISLQELHDETKQAVEMDARSRS